jgi:putative ABC transport system permease protein
MQAAASGSTARKVSLPLSEALRLSFDSIKVRLSRAAITTASIALEIAFLTCLLVLVNVLRYSGGTGIAVGAYQYWFAFISLLVSAVSITNSTLIAVYERYKEIGTMKCLGALGRHILTLFLIESTMLGFLGGLIGFGGGLAVATLQLGLASVSRVASVELFNSFILAMFLAVGPSVAATVYPVYRAARLNPVEALRFEI